MKLLLFLAYFLFAAKSDRAQVIQVEEAELKRAVPLEQAPKLIKPQKEVEAEGHKQLIEIILTADGRVEANSGKNELPSFDSKEAKKRKAFSKWIAKIQEEGPLQVAFKVDGDTKQQVVVDLLNVMAELKVTEITFSSLARK